MFYQTESPTWSYFEIPSKTIQEDDLSFDNNHDLLSVGVFIFQAKHLLKYYLKIWLQSMNTWQGFLCLRGEKAAPDES